MENKKESNWKWGFLRNLSKEDRKKYLESSAKIANEIGLYEVGNPNSALI